MSTPDPSKRIPKSLGTETKLFGTYTLSDLAVALLPGVVVVLLTQAILPPTLRVGGYAPQTLTLPVAALGIVLGGLFVFLTPAHASSLEWVAMFLGFSRSGGTLAHDAAKGETDVERVHPDDNVIERSDGALLGFVHVDPPTMALATDDEWARKAQAFQNFCNTTVEFPIQIYSTTQAFPAETYLEAYESRRTDPDVQDNPHLERLIEEYIAWYEADLADRQMTIRDHYVVVPVTPREVQFEHGSLIEKVASIPLVGLLTRIWLAPPRETQHDAMVTAVDERVTRVKSGLRDIEGCHANRLDAVDATQLLAEFWAGESREYEDLEAALRTLPFVSK